jgi:hypothetical protein
MLNFLGKLIGGICSFFTGGKKETARKPSNVRYLTGLTWLRAESFAIREGKRIAHHQWEADEYAYYDSETECFVKVKGHAVQSLKWRPSYGEENGGNAWAVLTD